MKIKNYSKYISTKELEQVLELLPEKYRRLNVKVVIFRNKIHRLLFDIFIRFELIPKDVTGEFDNDCNQIRIFPTDLLQDEYHKIRIIDTFLHEIRHKYQSIYKEKQFKRDNENYITNSKNYETYKKIYIEIDARRFSRTTLHKCRDRINTIVSLPDKYGDWEIKKDY